MTLTALSRAYWNSYSSLVNCLFKSFPIFSWIILFIFIKFPNSLHSLLDSDVTCGVEEVPVLFSKWTFPFGVCLFFQYCLQWSIFISLFFCDLEMHWAWNKDKYNLVRKQVLLFFTCKDSSSLVVFRWPTYLGREKNG